MLVELFVFVEIVVGDWFELLVWSCGLFIGLDDERYEMVWECVWDLGSW